MQKTKNNLLLPYELGGKVEDHQQMLVEYKMQMLVCVNNMISRKHISHIWEAVHEAGKGYKEHFPTS